MKTPDNFKKKLVYTAPQIECVKIDQEISLALESDPPFGPNEIANNVPENNSYDYFKSIQV